MLFRDTDYSRNQYIYMLGGRSVAIGAWQGADTTSKEEEHMTTYEGDSGTKPVPGIKGTNSAGGDGVFGFATLSRGVIDRKFGRGVVGVSSGATGVEGNSTTGAGVWGESQANEGVHGLSHGDMAGVAGYNDVAAQPGPGGPGVWGESQANEGVHGLSHSKTLAGISGANAGGGPAGFFDGYVVVTGTIFLGPSGTDLSVTIKQLTAQVKQLTDQVNLLQDRIDTIEGSM